MLRCTEYLEEATAKTIEQRIKERRNQKENIKFISIKFEIDESDLEELSELTGKSIQIMFHSCSWQRHRKDTAPARPVGNGDGAVMKFHNLQGDRQTQPEVPFGASGFFCPVEAGEDALLIAVGNADAGVADGDLEEIFSVLTTGERQRYKAVFRRVADGIVQQDREHLRDAVGIAG